MDPFYNECRAYGRLVEKGLNGKVAVRCHGYTTLPPEKEEELAQKFGVYEWYRPDEDYAKALPKRLVFRALVKDFVREDVPLTHKVVVKMLRDLKTMREAEIYNMDIYARNYKGGLLIDFSIAMTAPHYLFDIKSEWWSGVQKKLDLFQFDRMIRSEEVVTNISAVANDDYLAKLRPRKKKQ
ncbi:MAG: hypothetical protein Q9190_007804 [Brigantiaea leucoxantha]